jgi:hypothetical protein
MFDKLPRNDVGQYTYRAKNTDSLGNNLDVSQLTPCGTSQHYDSLASRIRVKSDMGHGSTFTVTLP